MLPLYTVIFVPYYIHVQGSCTGALLAPRQRARCNQSSWVFCPVGLGYHLHNHFVSEVRFTDKYNSLPHKEVPGFSPDIFNIIFLSPAFLSKHFQISSQLGFPNALRKGGEKKGVTFNYFVEKERNYLH